MPSNVQRLSSCLVVLLCLISLAACGGGGGGGGGSGSGSARSWSGPVQLEPAEAYYRRQWVIPTLLTDSSGAVTVLWHQYDGANVSIYSARRTSKGRWVKTLAETGAFDAICLASELDCKRSTPAVVDSLGNITLAWPSYVSGQWYLAVNRYVPGVGWEGETRFDSEIPITAPFNIQDQIITVNNMLVDAQGRVTILWTWYDAVNKQQKYSYAHHDGGSWQSGAVTPIGTRANAGAKWAINSVTGEVMVVWSETTPASTYPCGGSICAIPARIDIKTASFKPGSGWDSAQVLLGQDAGSISIGLAFVNIATDGRFGILYVETTDLGYPNGSKKQMFMKHRDVAGAWGAAEAINADIDQTGVQDFKVHSIVNGPLGKLMVFSQRRTTNVDIDNRATIYRHTYDPALGWSVSRSEGKNSRILSSSTYVSKPDISLGDIKVEVTSDGHVFMFSWDLPSDPAAYTYSIKASRYTFDIAATGENKQFADQVYNPGVSNIVSAIADVDPSGNAIFGYATRGGSVRVARYVEGDGWQNSETIAALAEAEAARPGVFLSSINQSSDGTAFITYRDVDYEAYAGVFHDPDTGWAEPGFLAGNKIRLIAGLTFGAYSTLLPDNSVLALVHQSDNHGLDVFEGTGAVDVPFSTTILPRTAPAPAPNYPTSTSGTIGGSNVCEGTNTNPPRYRNYIDLNFPYIRACGDVEVQIGSLVDGADVYFDAYVNAITNLGCTEKTAAATYDAHRETALIAKRLADIAGCD